MKQEKTETGWSRKVKRTKMNKNYQKKKIMEKVKNLPRYGRAQILFYKYKSQHLPLL